MPSFHQRKAIGDAHEQRVAQELTRRGWSVNTWGQGVLTAPVRHALRHTDSSLRWTPDLIAARGERVALIDCKSRMTSHTTRRHAVEGAAVTAHLQLVAWTQLPVYYVFDNLDVLTPHDVLTAGRRGPRARAGSGSAYFLITAACSAPFEDIFGSTRSTPPLSAAA